MCRASSAMAPTITEIADQGGKVVLLSHYGRPKGPDPKESLKPVVAAVARIIKRPIAFAEDCVGPIAEKAVAALEARRNSLPGEYPLSQGRRKERSGFRRGSSPSSATSMWMMRSRSRTARMPRSRHRASAARLCGARDAGGARSAGKSAAFPGPAGRRNRRRREDFNQARPPRQSDHEGRDADHRRRHGEYVPRRAGKAGRQVALRKRSDPDSARHPRQGKIAPPRNRAAGRRRRGAKICRPCSLARRLRWTTSAQPT